MVNEFSAKNIVKYGTLVVGGITLSLVILNSFTITDAGTTKVQTTFGTVNQEAYLEGIHFPVNPLSSFDVFDTRNARYEVNGLNIPTQDRFNSTANVTVLYRIDGSKAPYIKQNYGTAQEYIDKTLRQQLRSVIRDEGRKLPDSRSLAQSDSVSIMQSNTTQRLVQELDGTGVEIQDVLIQDIEFDPRIAQQILKTQERIQAEEAEKSKERLAKTQAEIMRQQAIGESNKKREEADAYAYKLTTEANASKAAKIAEAEGKAQAIELEATAQAEANTKLTRSLTAAILEKQRLDNEGILFSKSVGNVPTTVIGDTDLRALGVPFATSVK
jgi:regulator of protease activity HflC (stomatin/prohibitin superfamily)